MILKALLVEHFPSFTIQLPVCFHFDFTGKRCKPDGLADIYIQVMLPKGVS